MTDTLILSYNYIILQQFKIEFKIQNLLMHNENSKWYILLLFKEFLLKRKWKKKYDYMKKKKRKKKKKRTES